MTFLLFYLFDCKFVDLTIFYFLQDKICVPEKLGASQRFGVPEYGQLALGRNLSRSVF